MTNPVLTPAGTSRPRDVALCAAIVNDVAPSRADTTRSSAVPVTVNRPGGLSVVGAIEVTCGAGAGDGDGEGEGEGEGAGDGEGAGAGAGADAGDGDPPPQPLISAAQVKQAVRSTLVMDTFPSSSGRRRY